MLSPQIVSKFNKVDKMTTSISNLNQMDDKDEDGKAAYKVKYTLNKVENLDTSKQNVSMPLNFDRQVINDTNIKIDMNSDLYLQITEDMAKQRKGETEPTDGVTIVVKSSTAVANESNNNTETMIKFFVTSKNTR